MQWTWDPDKRAINLRRHGVKFEDVLPMLDDSLSRIEPDDRHYEDRYVAIGDVNGTITVVIYTLPTTDSENEPGRIISARKATPKERNEYENNR